MDLSHSKTHIYLHIAISNLPVTMLTLPSQLSEGVQCKTIIVSPHTELLMAYTINLIIL